MKYIKILFILFFPLIFICSLLGNELPTITKPVIVSDWQYTGPFETGAREGAVDPLYPWSLVQPDFGYPSAFAEDANNVWKSVKGDEKGGVTVVFSNAPWSVLGESWGVVGINYTGVCKGYINVDKRCKAKISTKGVRGVILNGMSIMTDYYGLKRWEPPVILESGRNEIVLKLNSYSDTVNFNFTFHPDSDNVRIIENDVTFPDAVENTMIDSWAGVPIVNCSDEWLKKITLEAGGGEYFVTNTMDNISIPPLGVIKVPVRLQNAKAFPSVSGDKEKNFVLFTIKVNDDIKQYNNVISVKIPLKKHDEDRRETFLSKMDGSVQFYGIKEPNFYDAAKRYGLIFTLHGAGVNALGQVGAYAPRDWAFVVAPTNRREYGFNWQEQGRMAP